MCGAQEWARAALAQALEDDAFGDAVDALTQARVTQRGILWILGLNYSTWSLRNWRDGRRDPPEAVWPALRLLLESGGWERVNAARALYPDRRGK